MHWPRSGRESVSVVVVIDQGRAHVGHLGARAPRADEEYDRLTVMDSAEGGRPAQRRSPKTWADNVVGLCRGARMELNQQDVAAIRAWVGGGLLKK